MALTKVASVIKDWTALASGTVALGGTFDVSDAYSALVAIQAFCNTDATANAGTEFLIQGRASASDTNENWYDIARFIGLVGTDQVVGIGEDVAVDEERVTVDENPTTIFTIGTSDAVLPWGGLEDAGALADSEMVMVTDGDADEIWVLPSNVAGTEYFENVHDASDTINQIALSQYIPIGMEHYFIRVIINNNYDTNGPAINYRILGIKVTSL
jgi:hypothetical protein